MVFRVQSRIQNLERERERGWEVTLGMTKVIPQGIEVTLLVIQFEKRREGMRIKGSTRVIQMHLNLQLNWLV